MSKIVLPCSGDLDASRTSRESITEIFRDSLATHQRVNASVAKKTQNILQKFRISCFSRLRLATCSRVEGLVASGTQRFLRLNSRLSRKWNFQSRKTLRKFSRFLFQVFWQLVLATCMRLEPVVKIACFGQTWSVFKPFQFSLEHF